MGRLNLHLPSVMNTFVDLPCVLRQSSHESQEMRKLSHTLTHTAVASRVLFDSDDCGTHLRKLSLQAYRCMLLMQSIGLDRVSCPELGGFNENALLPDGLTRLEAAACTKVKIRHRGVEWNTSLIVNYFRAEVQSPCQHGSWCQAFAVALRCWFISTNSALGTIQHTRLVGDTSRACTFK